MPNTFAHRFTKLFFGITGRLFLASFSVNILTWILLWKVGISGSSDSVLHYNVAYGVDFVDSSGKVFLLPITGLVIIIANTILSAGFKNNHIIRRQIASVSLFCSIILLFSSWLLLEFVL